MKDTIKKLEELKLKYEDKAKFYEGLGYPDSAMNYVLKSITLSQTISILNGEIVKRANGCGYKSYLECNRVYPDGCIDCDENTNGHE